MGLVLTSCEFGKEEENIDPLNDKNVIGFNFQDLNGWSDVTICKDGSMYFVDKELANENISSVFAVSRTEENKLVAGYIKFEEDNIPNYIAFDNARLHITDINNETISFSMLYTEDGIDYIYNVENYPHSFNFYSDETRAAKDNNWVRNAVAVGEIALGAIEVGAGTIMVVGTLAAPEVAPVSLALGGASIATGTMSIKSGYDKLFTAPENYINNSNEFSNNLGELDLQMLGEIAELEGTVRMPDNYVVNKTISIDSELFNKVGWGTFLAGLGLSAIDAMWGETRTEEMRLLEAYSGYKVTTGRSENVLSAVATLWGYVSPTNDLPNGAQSEVEYGINVCAAGSHSPLYKHEVIGGPGAVFKHTFKGLQPNTEYSYRTYFCDKINTVGLLGPIKNFKTSNEEAYIENVEFVESYCDKALSLPDGEAKFVVNVTARYDYSEENAPYEWGVIAYHKGESIGYIKFNVNGGTSKKLRLNIDKSLLKVNESEYIAEVEDLCFATYIEPLSGPAYYSKEYYPVDNLIYDKKPSLTITDAQVGETTPCPYHEDYQYTYFSNKLNAQGVLWMNAIFFEGPFSLCCVFGDWDTHDGIMSFGGDLHYYKDSNGTSYGYYETEVNGEKFISNNRVAFHYNKERPVNVTLEDASTTRAINNIGNEEENHTSVGDSCYMVPNKTEIKLSDTHNSKYRVIEEIKCPNGSVIEILE